jgi:hypothetical protein
MLLCGVWSVREESKPKKLLEIATEFIDGVPYTLLSLLHPTPYLLHPPFPPTPYPLHPTPYILHKA